MLRKHPTLNALMWAMLGALAATVVFLTYSALAPGTQKSDAELDREAASAHR